MMTDLEGVAGVVSFESQAYADGQYYEAAKKLLTYEINATVDGLLQAGATEIIVIDGHGPGAISFEDLHPEAKLIHGRPLAPQKVRDELYKDADAAIMIGQHSMAGTQNGNMNHTQNSRTVEYYKLNGKMIGEIAQFALYMGALNIPMIFLSGDDAACKEAEELIPGIVTATVKTGLSRNSAMSLSKEKSHELIREKSFEALQNFQKTPLAPLSWQGPFILGKRFFQTDVADSVASQEGVKRIDSQTVQSKSDNICDIIYK